MGFGVVDACILPKEIGHRVPLKEIIEIDVTYSCISESNIVLCIFLRVGFVPLNAFVHPLQSLLIVLLIISQSCQIDGTDDVFALCSLVEILQGFFTIRFIVTTFHQQDGFLTVFLRCHNVKF